MGKERLQKLLHPQNAEAEILLYALATHFYDGTDVFLFRKPLKKVSGSFEKKITT